MRRISRLVIILGTNSLDEEFVYQVTIYMLHPLRFQILYCERLNKRRGADRQCPNKSHFKHGIRVPRNSKEADNFDKDNGNTLWENTILK